MRTKVLRGLILAISIVVSVGYAQGAGTAGYAAMGDSLTDEYQFADAGTHSAGRNWLEQLATTRGLNFGDVSTSSRGVPRYQGYEYNWARAGATTETLMSENQPSGVAAQIRDGKIKLVCLMIGNNDFAFNYSTLYTGGDWSTLVNNAIARVHTAVNAILDTNPPAKIVLATIPDWELDPWYRINFPVAANRQRIRDAIAEYNRRIKSEFTPGTRVMIADIYQLSLDILADNQLKVGGFEIDLNNWGDTPDKVILADHIHPGTITQGLIANEFIKAMNQAGESIPLLTDLEILNNAGVYSLQAGVAAGSGQVSPTEGSYIKNTVVTLTAAPDSGSRVKAWTGTNNDRSTSLTNQVTITGNKTVSVTFESIPGNTQYTLSAGVVAGHGTIAPATGKYDPGTVVTLTATPDTGFQVKQWTGTDNDALTSSDINTVTMNADKTVSVTFEAIPGTQYKLTTGVVGGHGTIAPGPGQYVPGTPVMVTATPDTDYQVKQWTGTDNDAVTSNTNTVTMNADKTVSVNFEPIPKPKFQLNATVVGGHGTLTPPPGKYEIGRKLNLVATPDVGYRLRKWTGTANNFLRTNTNTVVMDSDKTVTVEFEQYQFHLTIKIIGGNGKIWPLGGYYDAGLPVALQATPDSGYQVKQWTGTDDDTSSYVSNHATMISDRTVSVEFIAATSGSNQEASDDTLALTPENEQTPVTSTTGCPGSGALLILLIGLAGMLLEFKNKE